MIKTSLVHVAFALAFQAAIGALAGNLWVGAAFAAAWFISREHAQRQYKLAAGRSIKDLKPWEGMDVINWTRDAKLDAALPLVAVVVLALACS